MALFKFTESILENKKIQIYNHGNHERDFTYIDDIVDGCIKVADSPLKKIKIGIAIRQIYHAAHHHGKYTILEIASPLNY